MRSIQVVDSHTGGEPTRVVLAGGPDLGTGSMADRRELFRMRFDAFRSAVVNEPRGSDVLVGTPLPRSIPTARRRDLLQQRWPAEHVRPRDYRPGGDNGALGFDWGRSISL